MNFISWIISLFSTTIIIGLATFLGRNFIAGWFAKAIQHRYDKILETKRSDLREKEAQIAALREGALSGMSNRQIALDERRLEAAEQIWSAVGSLGSLEWNSSIMATVDFEKAAKTTKENPKARQLFEILTGQVNPELLKNSSHDARPFVTPIVWALFSAYRSVLYLAFVRSAMLKTGAGAPELIDSASCEKLLVAALPEYKEYIQKNGPAGYHYLLEEIKERLLKAIRDMLDGKETDEATIKRSANILEAVEAIQNGEFPQVDVPKDLKAAPIAPPPKQK